jgi:Ca-activated chloride channel family protein
VTIEKEAFDLVRRSLGKANFFAFGIGSGVNRFLVEGLAHAGQGEPFIITKEEEAPAVAEKFRKYISQPVLTDLNLSFNDFEVYDLAQESYPDVFADRPVLIFGKYKGNPTGSIVISGNRGDSRIENRVDLASAQSGGFTSGLRYLWAREKIMYMDDYANSGYADKASDDQLLALALEYNLLTRLTSFIAIDSETRNSSGECTTITQPLPLPQGVSNYAVGRSVGGVSAGQSKMTVAECSVMEDKATEEYEYSEQVSSIEVPAEFRGGEKALDEFIRRNLVYPAESAKNNISGTVIVEFTVETDGSIKEIRILYSLDKYTDQEVVRVVNLMKGYWKPAEIDGKPVRSRVILKKFVFRP